LQALRTNKKKFLYTEAMRIHDTVVLRVLLDQMIPVPQQ
jgi:hypothetical protein